MTSATRSDAIERNAGDTGRELIPSWSSGGCSAVSALHREPAAKNYADDRARRSRPPARPDRRGDRAELRALARRGAAAIRREGGTPDRRAYAALGVIDQSGTALERFFTTGIDLETQAAIGDPPRAEGSLACSSARRRRSGSRRSAPTRARSASPPTTPRCGRSSGSHPASRRGVRQPVPHGEARW